MRVFFPALDRAREIERLGVIAAVFARHGLGDVVRRSGLASLFERAGSGLRLRAGAGLAEKRPEVRLREAFEQLGPCFVKLGQLLAGRSDLLPPAWAAELSKLREDVAPVPFEELRAQLEEDLGGDPRAIFRDLDPKPLAAGSIAQVHRAALQDGTEVVLKVRRPGIEDVVAADLRLLARLAESLEERRDLRICSPRSVVRQLERVLRGELDLSREARNTERLRAALPPFGPIVIPRVHDAWTRERLLVMDYLEGPSLERWIREGMPGGRNPAQIARAGADAVLRMVFVEGVYHADPHPGNVILLEDGRLGLVDFGQIGFVSDERRRQFIDLLAAVVTLRPDDAAEVLLEWSEGETDASLFEQDCAEFIDRYRGRALAELRASDLVADINRLAREHGMMLPADVALLLKVFLTLEDLGRSLDPAFVVSAFVEPFVQEAGRKRFGLRWIPRSANEVAQLVSELPRDLRRLRSMLRRGGIGVQVDLKGLERFSAQVDRSVNHLTIGMITSALIVGTAVAMTVSGGPRPFGLPLFGALGFASSVAVGVWWMFVTHRRP